MKALLCGSLAYDSIMVFEDRFANHILPDQVHILNVSFHVPQLRKEFGGCAGNIAYNLKLLGTDCAIMATVGEDFEPYARWMDKCGIDREYIKVVGDTYTAQAYITTDMDDNQITAFHPGAMNHSHLNSVAECTEPIKLGIVSPDGKDGMIQHASQFVEAGVPFIFDPGQGMPLFSGEELDRFVDQATWLTLNDYEAKLLTQRTGKSLEELARKVDALIVTLGGKGSVIHADGEVVEVPTAKVSEVNDPTGCGDAYRAGLIHGIINSMDWKTTGRVAALMGALKVECHGTQNHTLAAGELEEKFHASFGYGL